MLSTNLPCIKIILAFPIQVSVHIQAYLRRSGCLQRPRRQRNSQGMMHRMVLQRLLYQVLADPHMLNHPYLRHRLPRIPSLLCSLICSLMICSANKACLCLLRQRVPLLLPEFLALLICNTRPIRMLIRIDWQRRTHWRRRFGECTQRRKQHYLMLSGWKI